MIPPTAADRLPICPICWQNERLIVPLVYHAPTGKWWHEDGGPRARNCRVVCYVEVPTQPDPDALAQHKARAA